MDAAVSEVRLARPADAEAIGLIRVRAWQAAYRAFMPQSYLDDLDPQQSLDTLRQRIAEGGSSFTALIASLADETAGFAILGEPRYESAPRVCELWALYVDPAVWRRGIGRALLAVADRQAEAAGRGWMELWCIAGNLAARRLYERHGFEGPQGERTTTVLTGVPLDEVLYRKNLG